MGIELAQTTYRFFLQMETFTTAFKQVLKLDLDFNWFRGGDTTET